MSKVQVYTDKINNTEDKEELIKIRNQLMKYAPDNKDSPYDGTLKLVKSKLNRLYGIEIRSKKLSPDSLVWSQSPAPRKTAISPKENSEEIEKWKSEAIEWRRIADEWKSKAEELENIDKIWKSNFHRLESEVIAKIQKMADDYIYTMKLKNEEIETLKREHTRELEELENAHLHDIEILKREHAQHWKKRRSRKKMEVQKISQVFSGGNSKTPEKRKNKGLFQ